MTIQQLLQVLVQVLEDEVDLEVDVDHVVEAHHVRVVEFLQNGDLADRRRRHTLRLPAVARFIKNT